MKHLDVRKGITFMLPMVIICKVLAFLEQGLRHHLNDPRLQLRYPTATRHLPILFSLAQQVPGPRKNVTPYGWDLTERLHGDAQRLPLNLHKFQICMILSLKPYRFKNPSGFLSTISPKTGISKQAPIDLK